MQIIKTYNKISPVGLAHFPKNLYTIDAEAEQYDAIILRSFKLHELEFPSHLKAIARAGAGYNNVPVDRCTESGIVAFNTPGANANGVKELVIASMLMISRDVIGGIKWAKTLIGQGDAVPKLVEKGKSNFKGPEITGKTMGIVGLGAIGGLVAQAAHDLGMKVVAVDGYLSEERQRHFSTFVELKESKEEVLAEADYLSLHIPANAQNKDYINSESISLMKDNARIFNFGRGPLVNNDDVMDALNEGKLSWYVTDFPNENLLLHDKVLGIPHLGASTPESEDNSATMAAQQIRAYLEHGNLVNSVNFPNVVLERTTEHRLIVGSRREANVSNQIVQLLDQQSYQVESLVTKNRGELSYSIFDLTQALPKELLSQVQAMEGVLIGRIL